MLLANLLHIFTLHHCQTAFERIGITRQRHNFSSVATTKERSKNVTVIGLSSWFLVDLICCFNGCKTWSEASLLLNVEVKSLKLTEFLVSVVLSPVKDGIRWVIAAH